MINCPKKDKNDLLGWQSGSPSTWAGPFGPVGFSLEPRLCLSPPRRKQRRRQLSMSEGAVATQLPPRLGCPLPPCLSSPAQAALPPLAGRPSPPCFPSPSSPALLPLHRSRPRGSCPVREELTCFEGRASPATDFCREGARRRPAANRSRGRQEVGCEGGTGARGVEDCGGCC